MSETMAATARSNWHEANQRYLMAALGEVRCALQRHADRPAEAPDTDEGAQQELRQAAAAMPAPPALEVLCALFGLSAFERQVLLLCAGVELDGSFAALCAAAQGSPGPSHPTFALALAALGEAHWSALSPAGPLRYWRLVELAGHNGLTTSPLRVDERVLHYLAGVEHLDERLVGLVVPLQQPGELVASHRVLAGQLAATWTQAAGKGPLPVVQLCSTEQAGHRAIAAAACADLGLDLQVMPAQGIPLDAREQEALCRLWEREAALSRSALLLECGDMEPADAAREAAVTHLIERISGALIVAGRERRPSAQRVTVTLEVDKPTTAEQRALWQEGVGRALPDLESSVEALVGQFNLSIPTIRSVCAGALGQMRAGTGGGSAAKLGPALWNACRLQARPRLENLAQRIASKTTWEDLVLPAAQIRLLREVAVHVRQRMMVYETWGFASKSARGLGISALFAGASGTGKTMAAEVLANELELDLFCIDLSQVVSKYIGETEKNLRRVFDGAEEGGAILLFDEADALFGRRSEVKDSHDRYANIEVSYLLQRMEGYRGLAILTSNMKDALDRAFLRRLRFVIEFPFPGPEERGEIWRRIFPADTPTEKLDVNKLARLNVAGGSIRSIALYAAFLASEAGEPVRMPHLLRAAQVEYAKLEKSLTEAEIKGWI